jgi:hypothetical protein
MRPMCAAAPQGDDVGMTNSSTIALRTATDRDAAILLKLSALDSAPPLHAPAVVALVDGRPVAAASLSDASVVADPFVPTADVVELLQARVAAAASAAAARPRRRRLRFPARPPRLRAA